MPRDFSLWADDEPASFDPRRGYYKATMIGILPDPRENFCHCEKYGYPNSKGYRNGHSVGCEADYLNRNAGLACVKGEGGCGSRHHNTRDCVQNLRKRPA